MTCEGLKERLAARGYILNGYCQMPGAFSAEVYSRQGWDAVTLDLEHGSIGFDSAVAMLQAITASGAVPLARVAAPDPVTIGTMLDAGVLGITCAMISSGGRFSQSSTAPSAPADRSGSRTWSRTRSGPYTR